MRTMTGCDSGYYTFVEPAQEEKKVTTWERIKSRVHWVDLILISPMVIAFWLSC